MALLLLLVAAIPLPSPARDAPIDAEQFDRIMAGLHAEIEDVSFVFEGRERGVPLELTVEDLLAGADPEAPHLDYQGQYAFRSDGATRLDRFDSDTFITTPGKESPNEVHQFAVMLAGRIERVTSSPTERNERPISRPGGPGSLNEPGSPMRICYLWYFQKGWPWAENHYKFLGWETIDGHRCAKVQFIKPAPTPGHPDGQLGQRFWIDLERGGHPLKVEYIDPSGLSMRVAGIRLAQFEKPDGKTIWLPVRGYCENFATGQPQRPVGLETYYVVDGTVHLNQGLPDEVFTLDWDGKLPEPESLATQRREFRKPVPKRDPKSVRKNLEHRLAIAETQAPLIQATTPKQRQEPRTRLLQLGLAAAGAALLVAAGWIVWRRRR